MLLKLTAVIIGLISIALTVYNMLTPDTVWEKDGPIYWEKGKID